MPRPYPSKNLPLRPLTKTNASKRRQYRLGQVFQLPKLSAIPLIDFELDDNPIENQLLKADTLDDMCGPFALTSVLEPQEGEQLDPGFIQAKVKELQGDPNTWGATLEELADVARKKGALPLSKSPFPDRPRSFVSDPKNWDPVYDEYAAAHKQLSFIWVDGPYDTFDNILATLWLLKNLPANQKKTGILAGSYWYPEWQYAAGGVIPKIVSSRPSGHAFRIRGQKILNGERYLVIQNSYGKESGYQGLYYLPRQACKNLEPFGQLLFVDMDPEEVKAKKLGLIARILQLIQTTIYFLQLDSLPKAEPAPVVPEPEPEPTMPVQTEPKKIVRWAQAIQRHEGWFVGSRSYRNNNPGNIRSPYPGKNSDYTASLGAIGVDLGRFCIFPSPDAGFNALCTFLTHAASGKLKSYRPEMTLLEFYGVYAPSSDNNNPKTYAQAVAQYVGCTIDTPIKQLL